MKQRVHSPPATLACVAFTSRPSTVPARMARSPRSSSSSLERYVSRRAGTSVCERMHSASLCFAVRSEQTVQFCGVESGTGGDGEEVEGDDDPTSGSSSSTTTSISSSSTSMAITSTSSPSPLTFALPGNEDSSTAAKSPSKLMAVVP